MPVSVVLCEGVPGSPDARVLSRLLAGICEIRPSGGKYGMGERILSRREVLGPDAVFGVLDGDFKTWTDPVETPTDWKISQPDARLGWRWERKEIENYLIDPIVVSRALASPPADYSEMLGRAAARIAPYQAARIALTLSRPRFSPLPNLFGVSCGDSHKMPENFGEASCLEEAKRISAEWLNGQKVDENSVANRFAGLLIECLPGGARHCGFLTGFAGKDLLWAMRDDLANRGMASPKVFLERILSGISSTSEDISVWLPEWGRLKSLIEMGS